MKSLSAKIGIGNIKNAPHIVAIEPWGADYTLLSGENLEVIAFGDKMVPWFHIVEDGDGVQVFCEETTHFSVVQDGVELACGHNRQSKINE